MTNGKDLLQHLNPEQRQAVVHEGGPLLILAGAGSGKTRALTHRAAYLLQQGVPEDRILLVTFTNKAAGEMQDRLAKLSGKRLSMAGTFHSFCAKLLRIEGKALGISSRFVIYDEADRLAAAKLAMKRLDINLREYAPRSIIYAISAAKNELISADDYASFSRGPFQEVVARVYQEYQKALRKSQALDFDDLLYEAVRLLKTQVPIRQKYQTRFLHVLVDEYQDTNKAQYELTKMLAEKHKNLCVVGDASQSIYRFRGADYRNLMALQKDFPDLTTITLKQNYRSTQHILDAAYGVIGNNDSHPILELWTQAGDGQPLTVYEAQSERDEARFVLETINRLVRESDGTLALDDFAVLYRTNAQSRSLEEIFLRQGVPYELVGGVEFYQRKEVKDVIAYLRLIANPSEEVSFERAKKIGKRRLAAFELWRDAADLTRPPLELMEGVLEATDYMGLYDEDVDEDLMRLENIRELKSVASEFSDLDGFLENVALVQNKILPNGVSQSGGGKSVTLMTLHASKGLEFAVIFLVGMEEGLFPHSRSMHDKEEMEEERRLCYVGITRAKERLILTHAQQRLYFGTRSTSVASRFLAEIPERVLSGRQTSLTAEDDALLDNLLDEDFDVDSFLDS